MKKILTFGTFDVLHPGHVSYLTQAQNLGDEMHICVGRDKTVKDLKKNIPRNTEDKRQQELKEYFPDAIVFLGSLDDHMAVIRDVQPDIIALGYDQKSFVDELKVYIKENNIDVKIVRLSSFYPKLYKSSKLQKDDKGRQKNMHGVL